MDSQERLLMQIGQIIDEKLSRRFDDFSGEMDKRFEKIDERLATMDERFDALENEITKTQLQIENDVTKRLDSLFDGYKLTHEKQWEQERKIMTMQAQIETMQLASVDKVISGFQRTFCAKAVLAVFGIDSTMPSAGCLALTQRSRPKTL